jgi:hypothetical protein
MRGIGEHHIARDRGLVADWKPAHPHARKLLSTMERAAAPLMASSYWATVRPRLSRDFDEPVVGGDGGRILAMAKLARAYPDARIVYSGGDRSLFGNQPPETDFVHQLLDGLGVPRERVLLESRSRNTAENAAFTKELVKPKPGERWLW